MSTHRPPKQNVQEQDGEGSVTGSSGSSFFDHTSVIPAFPGRRMALVLVLMVVPYLLNISGPSVWDATEAFYAETPREMLELDSYIIPYFNYEPRLNKPPLTYYLVMPFYYLLGADVLVVRSISVFAMLLILLTTWALGASVFNQKAGLFGAAIVATTPRFWLIAQKSIIDITFTLLVTAALLFFWRMLRGGQSRTVATLFYVSLGLGVMTKGPLALALTGGVILTTFLFTGRWSTLRHMHLPLGGIILAAIILPWSIAVIHTHGWDPISAFIFRDNIGRFTSDIDWSNRGSFYYFGVFLADFFPWSLCAIPAVLVCIRHMRGKNEAATGAVYLLVWAGFIFLFFSLARNKHEYYLLPLYPGAGVLTGCLFHELTKGAMTRWARTSMRAVALVVGILLIGGSAVLVLILNREFSAQITSIMSLTVGICGVWILWVAGKGNMRTVPVSLVGTMFVCFILYQTTWLPVIEPYRPTKPLSDIIRKEAGPDDLVGSYNFAAPSLTYYLRRRIFEVFVPETIREILGSDHRVFCLMPETDFKTVENALPGRLTVLARRPMLTLRLNALSDGAGTENMPQLLLITNQLLK